MSTTMEQELAGTSAATGTGSGPQVLPTPPEPGALLADRGLDAATWLARRVGRLNRVRRPLSAYVERRIRARIDYLVARRPLAAEDDGIALGLAAMASAERAFARNQLSAASLHAMLRTLYGDVLVQRGAADVRTRLRQLSGHEPPNFMLISPGRACNLHCHGCDASSRKNTEKLSWPAFKNLVSHARRDWGMRVFVISGGEPFAYHDQGRGVLDLAEAFPDCFFVVSTNGTLIREEVARRMGKLGNISPALSVDGMRAATDARRGAGVFDSIVTAIYRLQRAGVMYGIAAAPTRQNADEVLNDEVVAYFFEKLGALYGVVFHCMPIGRGCNPDLMVTPRQRQRLFDRVRSLIRERHVFVADLWNDAAVSNSGRLAGCAGGYLRASWNKDSAPGVLRPGR